jgi:DNA-binding MarR family transcriptional regulator
MGADDILASLRQNWPEAVTPQSVLAIKAQRLAALLQDSAQRTLAPFGLGFTEFEMLCALRSQPAPHRMLPSDLYDALLISSGGLTRVLKCLEARGLVSRPVPSGDRRRHPVALTRAGQSLVEAAMAEVQRVDAARLGAAPLRAADYATLGRLLGAALRGLEPGTAPQRAMASLRSR